MVRREFEYPKGEQNTVNRYKHQATYSLRTIHTIINTTPVLHISFNPNSAPNSPAPFPVILPMIGQMGSFDHPSRDIGEPLDCYLHGYVSSRIMNLSRAEGRKGLPVCISATKVDGLVLSLTPYSHNYNYRSSVLFGHATLVEDTEEKLFAMELITNSVVPSRWTNSRTPPTAAEMASTQILRVKIDSGSAKIREGVPEDSKSDLEDDEVLERVWTGVLPLYERLGEPVPGPYNKVMEVPEYVRGWKEEINGVCEEYAREAAEKDAPVKRKEGDEEE